MSRPKNVERIALWLAGIAVLLAVVFFITNSGDDNVKTANIGQIDGNVSDSQNGVISSDMQKFLVYKTVGLKTTIRGSSTLDGARWSYKEQRIADGVPGTTPGGKQMPAPNLMLVPTGGTLALAFQSAPSADQIQKTLGHLLDDSDLKVVKNVIEPSRVAFSSATLKGRALTLHGVYTHTDCELLKKRPALSDLHDSCVAKQVLITSGPRK